jgi:bifunctional DNA-binding transcriptional regulator/antitoxin component of YhaV-PrlF toxin-antitoxin module
MAKVTSKLQVTLPRAIADRYGIRPGDDIQWQPAGTVIQVVPPGKQAPGLSLEDRLKLFDAATIRQKLRRRRRRGKPGHAADRGWRREDAYTRGRAR